MRLHVWNHRLLFPHRKIEVNHLSDDERLGQVKLHQVKLDQVKLDQVKLDKVKLDQVKFRLD